MESLQPITSVRMSNLKTLIPNTQQHVTQQHVIVAAVAIAAIALSAALFAGVMAGAIYGLPLAGVAGKFMTLLLNNKAVAISISAGIGGMGALIIVIGALTSRVFKESTKPGKTLEVDSNSSEKEIAEFAERENLKIVKKQIDINKNPSEICENLGINKDDAGNVSEMEVSREINEFNTHVLTKFKEIDAEQKTINEKIQKAEKNCEGAKDLANKNYVNEEKRIEEEKLKAKKEAIGQFKEKFEAAEKEIEKQKQALKKALEEVIAKNKENAADRKKLNDRESQLPIEKQKFDVLIKQAKEKKIDINNLEQHIEKLENQQKGKNFQNFKNVRMLEKEIAKFIPELKEDKSNQEEVQDAQNKQKEAQEALEKMKQRYTPEAFDKDCKKIDALTKKIKMLKDFEKQYKQQEKKIADLNTEIAEITEKLQKN